MNTVRRVIGTLAVSSALTLVSALGASPASANTGADAELVLGPNGTSSTSVATVTLGANNGDGTRSVAFTCSGLSTGDTSATAVRACQLRVNGVTVQSASPLSLPGATASTGGARLSVPVRATVTACSFVTSWFVVSPSLQSTKCAAPIVVAA